MTTEVILEWFGYLASIVVAGSLLMNSLLKLRWINLVGAFMFSIYGFLIGATPVGILNGFIVCINAFYLYHIYTKKEYFQLLPTKDNAPYLTEFIKYHKNDILKFSPNFTQPNTQSNNCFFVMQNMQVVGLFIAHRHDSETLLIDLDFAIPEFRDFKLAKFVFENKGQYFRERGYTKLFSPIQSDEHNRYLKKIGFQKIQLDSEEYFMMQLP